MVAIAAVLEYVSCANGTIIHDYVGCVQYMFSILNIEIFTVKGQNRVISLGGRRCSVMARIPKSIIFVDCTSFCVCGQFLTSRRPVHRRARNKTGLVSSPWPVA